MPRQTSDGQSVYLLEVIPERRAGRGRWWKPDCRGYTDNLEKAGLYSESVARNMTMGSQKSVAVPVANVLAGLRENRREIDAQIAHLEGTVCEKPPASVG